MALQVHPQVRRTHRGRIRTAVRPRHLQLRQRRGFLRYHQHHARLGVHRWSEPHHEPGRRRNNHAQLPDPRAPEPDRGCRLFVHDDGRRQAGRHAHGIRPSQRQLCRRGNSDDSHDRSDQGGPLRHSRKHHDPELLGRHLPGRSEPVQCSSRREDLRRHGHPRLQRHPGDDRCGRQAGDRHCDGHPRHRRIRRGRFRVRQQADQPGHLPAAEGRQPCRSRGRVHDLQPARSGHEGRRRRCMGSRPHDHSRIHRHRRNHDPDHPDQHHGLLSQRLHGHPVHRRQVRVHDHHHDREAHVGQHDGLHHRSEGRPPRGR